MNYATEVLSQSAGPAIALNAALRQYFRVSHSFEDENINALIAAATDAIQTRMTRQILTATRRINMRCFPGQEGWQPLQTPILPGSVSFGSGDDPILMPWPKLVSVQAIKYRDTDGALQSYTTFDVDTIGNGVHGMVRPSRGEFWPLVDTISPIPAYMDFTCGYGATQADIPTGLQLAIKALALFWFENREAGVGIPEHIEAALDLYKTGRVN